MKPLYRLLILAIAATISSTNAFSQCEPYFGKLVINEVMPANNLTVADENGEYDDWVEIYNSTDQAINMEGYFLSDNNGNKTKFVFPDVLINPNGFLIIWCDDQVEQGNMHAAFKLSSTGEEVGLYNPDTISLDFVRYGSTPDDVTVGRYPNGSGPFARLLPTYDNHNTNSIEVGLVINEYQAINETTIDDQWGGFEDWIELYNNSSQPIDMTGFFLSDKISDPTIFSFPDTTIQPDSYMIIWCDMGLQEPGLHTFFKLGSDGDDIILSNTDTLTLDYVRFGPQIPDDSEGRFGNGTGPIACMIPTFEASNGFPTYINEINALANFRIFPNPTSGYVKVELFGQDLQPLHIYNMEGKLVKTIQAASGTVNIDLSTLSPGMYFVRSEKHSQKLIID